MLNQRRKAGRHVAQNLFQAETDIDKAICSAAGLMVAMLTARQEAGLSATIGQDAMAKTARIVAALVEGREQIVATHHELDATRKQIGLDASDYGSGGGKYPVEGQSGLHVVGTKAA